MMRLIITAIMACVTAGLGSAQQTFIQSGTGGSFGQQISTRTLGYMFSVGSNPISVTSLGAFDYQGDGLLGTVDIGIWNPNSGQLLGNVTVPTGTTSPLQGAGNYPSGSGFRYSTLASPITLNANTTYVVGSLTRGSDPNWYDLTSVSTGPGLSYIDAMFSSSASQSLVLPQSFSSELRPGFFGPNMQYTIQPVPEPASILGMVAAFMGAVHFGRRKLLRQSKVAS